MNPNNPDLTAKLLQKRTNRRQGPDIWIKCIPWIGYIGWLTMAAALLVLDAAKPEAETTIQRHWDPTLRQTWDPELTLLLFILMTSCMCLNLLGLALNLRRNRRKSDPYRIYLFMLGIIAGFGMMFYIL